MIKTITPSYLKKLKFKPHDQYPDCWENEELGMLIFEIGSKNTRYQVRLRIDDELPEFITLKSELENAIWVNKKLDELS